MCYVPQWASDSAYWNDPPPGYGNGYQSFYPMTAGALTDYEAFAEHLATALKGEVLGYEAFDEPNLWPYIYPQRTAADPWFAARRVPEVPQGLRGRHKGRRPSPPG